MGLTSSTVLAIATALAVLLLAATVLWWPRLARTTWTAVLGRIAALLTTQLAVLCAIGLVANNYFAFYSSWDDLLGTGDTGPVSVQASVEGRPPRRCRWSRPSCSARSRWRAAAAAPSGPARSSPCGSPARTPG
ncbi:hypothetical protein ACFQ1I_35395 [Kitasatospora arboriphila]